MMILRWIMKKIEFGFNNDDNLNATWSNIEQYNGEYLDTIRCNDMDFLVTRIVDSREGLDGGIDVREVAQDYYSDGTYITYSNNKKSDLCKKLENFLNNKKVRDKLASDRALTLLRAADFPVFTSRLLKIEGNSEEFAEVITGIKPEVFKKLKDSKRAGMGMSMFRMTEELRRLYKRVEELEEEKKTGKQH